jgi:hypothetical protein
MTSAEEWGCAAQARPLQRLGASSSRMALDLKPRRFPHGRDPKPRRGDLFIVTVSVRGPAKPRRGDLTRVQSSAADLL